MFLNHTNLMKKKVSTVSRARYKNWYGNSDNLDRKVNDSPR